MAKPSGNVEIPSTNSEYVKFNETFFAKHEELGQNSPLLKLTDINWASLKTQSETFANLVTVADLANKNAYQAGGFRNEKSALLTDFVNQSRNLLKVIYANNLRVLADWGFWIQPEGRGKITNPGKGSNFVTFIKTLLAKHTAMGQNSPLLSLPNIDWAKINAAVAFYEDKNDEMEMYMEEARQANAQKEVLRPTLYDAQLRAKNLLKTLSGNNLRSLTTWGFTVTTTGKSKTKTTDTPQPNA